MWLPPGGHREPDATSLYQSAAREVLAETSLVLGPDPYMPLLDIDTHPIPARPSKNEGRTGITISCSWPRPRTISCRPRKKVRCLLLNGA
ncbi:hypothetical protein ACOTHJ_15075 [Achromobacter xylosoxidans]